MSEALTPDIAYAEGVRKGAYWIFHTLSTALFFYCLGARRERADRRKEAGHE